MRLVVQKIFSFFLFLIVAFQLSAQTDYSQLSNWYYHPSKAINFIGDYKLDISVIGKDLSIDSIISIKNNSESNTGIDVFWLHPTQLTNPPSYPSNVALDEQPYSLIAATILAQGGLLSKYGRFYAPRFQQSTPASFLNSEYSDSTRAAALLIAYRDVKAAFEHYLKDQNNGNKIILAGHSQGAFLLAMLLRDVFDGNAELRSKLVTAALGGQGFYHAEQGKYVGGQFENIPLCTALNQCACVHTWRSFKETQQQPELTKTTPIFNLVLVDSGVLYRNANLSTDWFVQDSLYYSSTSSPLRYYIAPDANYGLGGGNNFIAFDSMYSARFKREGNTKISLAINYELDTSDQRPNDLLSEENSIGFPFLGYHNKDYHIYLWAFMDQIDAKIKNCQTQNSVPSLAISTAQIQVFPNPNSGVFNVLIDGKVTQGQKIFITDLLGRFVQEVELKNQLQIDLKKKGVYFLNSPYGVKKIVVK